MISSYSEKGEWSGAPVYSAHLLEPTEKAEAFAGGQGTASNC